MEKNTALVDFVSNFIYSNSQEFFREINEFLYNNPETNYEVCLTLNSIITHSIYNDYLKAVTN